jgi:hypothetical protein
MDKWKQHGKPSYKNKKATVFFLDLFDSIGDLGLLNEISIFQARLLRPILFFSTVNRENLRV